MNAHSPISPTLAAIYAADVLAAIKVANASFEYAEALKASHGKHGRMQLARRLEWLEATAKLVGCDDLPEALATTREELDGPEQEPRHVVPERPCPAVFGAVR